MKIQKIFLMTVLLALAAFAIAETQLDVRVIREISAAAPNSLKAPSDAAFDADGTVFVSDTDNARVVAFGTDGSKRLEFGGKGSKEGALSEPVGIAVHGGKVFVADARACAIFVFDNKGKFLYSFGGSGSAPGKLKTPTGMVVSDQERVYVSERGAGRISVFTTQGVFIESIGEGIGSPTWLAMDRSGRFYVSDEKEKAIIVLDRFGKKIKALAVAETGVSQPGGVAVNERGWLLISDLAQGRIVRIDPSGKQAGSFGSAGAGRGQFTKPLGIQLGQKGAVSFADSGNNRVQILGVDLPETAPILAAAPALMRIAIERSIPVELIDVAVSSDGSVYALFSKGARVEIFARNGQKKGAFLPLSESELGKTKAARIAFGADRVYISDQGLNRVIVYDRKGTFLFAFGGRGKEKGKFSAPSGIAVSDKVYIADADNNRVQIFSLDGVPISEIGAAAYKFNQPVDVAFTKNKKLLIAEAGGRILQFSADGKFEKILVGPETNLLAGLQSIRVDEDGRIIAMTGGDKNERILIFDPSGKLLMRFGASGSGPGDLSNPGGMDYFAGTLFVADADNARVTEFVIMDVAGEPTGVKLACGPNSTTLTWNANTESYLKGYRIYAIDDSGKRTAIGETTETHFIIPTPLKSGESVFTLTAYSRDGLESSSVPPLIDWGRRGLAAVGKNDLNQAVEDFRKAVELNPADEFCVYMLAQTLLDSGKTDEAATYFGKLTESKKYSALGRLGLGRVAFMKGKLAEAEDQLNRSVAIDNQNPTARLFLAEVYYAQEKWDLALENAQEAANMLPLEPRASELLGLTYLGKRLYGKAERALLTAISLKADDANLYYELAKVYLAKNDPSKARAQLEKAIEKDPKSIDARLALGALLLSLKDIDGAQTQAQKIIELDPKNSGGYLLAGKILFAKGDREGAVESFQKAKNINPNDPEACVNLASAYLDLGDVAAADGVVQEALNKFPKSRDVFLVTAKVREAQNDLGAAIDALTKAVEIDPNSIEARLRKARLHLKKKEYQTAAGEFEQAARLSPDDVSVRIEWSEALKQAGQNAKAEEVLTDAINIDPNDPRAHFALGSLWFGNQDYARALPELKLAAFTAPDNPNYHYTLGKAYFAAGELESAVEELRRAYELDQKNETTRRDLDLATAALAKYRKSPNLPSLEIADVRVDPIFAAIYKKYDTNPVGKIVIRNNSAEAILKVKISFQVKKFQPAPTTVILEQIAPKNKVDVMLKAGLSDSVLDLRSDTPALGIITVEYFRKGGVQRLQTTAPFTLYSRNAIIWSNKAMLGAFVTPTDWPVSEFARQTMEAVGDAPEGVTDTLHRSAAIFEALGAYRMGYLEDPNRPDGGFGGQIERVDNVQFPRDTLRLRYGDCDDLSVLYSALLENLGVETAIAVLPDHVLTLVNSGVSPDDVATITDDKNQVVIYDGKVWIPVETTAIGAGFSEAWLKGADTVQKAAAQNKLDVVTVHEAWKKYPSAALSMSQQWLPEMPPQNDVKKRLEVQEALLGTKRIERETSELEAAIQADPNNPAPRLKLGIIYAQNGRIDDALEQFKAVIQSDPKNSDALTNIGNLSFIKGEYQAALESYTSAEETKPDDAEIKINLCLVYYRLGNLEKAREKFEQATGIDPDVAADNEDLKKLLYNQ